MLQFVFVPWATITFQYRRSHLEVFSALDALLERRAAAVGLREASRLARDADVFSHASDLAAKNGRTLFGRRK